MGRSAPCVASSAMSVCINRWMLQHCKAICIHFYFESCLWVVHTKQKLLAIVLIAYFSWCTLNNATQRCTCARLQASVNMGLPDPAATHTPFPLRGFWGCFQASFSVLLVSTERLAQKTGSKPASVLLQIKEFPHPWSLQDLVDQWGSINALFSVCRVRVHQ